MLACRSTSPLGPFGKLCRASVVLFPLLSCVLLIANAVLFVLDESLSLSLMLDIMSLFFMISMCVFSLIGTASYFMMKIENYISLSSVAVRLSMMSYLVPAAVFGIWAGVVLVVARHPPYDAFSMRLDNLTLEFAPYVLVVVLSVPLYFRFALVASSNEVCLVGEIFSLASIVVTIFVPSVLFAEINPPWLMPAFCFTLLIPIITFIVGSLKRYGKDKYFFGNDINSEGVFFLPDPLSCESEKVVAVPAEAFLVVKPNGRIRRGSIARNVFSYLFHNGFSRPMD